MCWKPGSCFKKRPTQRASDSRKGTEKNMAKKGNEFLGCGRARKGVRGKQITARRRGRHNQKKGSN